MLIESKMKHSHN